MIPFLEAFLRFGDVALLNFDGVAPSVRPGDGDKALGLLRFLALLGVVRRIEVEPPPMRG